jgi:uncharacterized protein (UPF0264 family)
MPPKLLVSIRNSFEAKIAAAEGVDIIDIKEPRQGSLGMASLDVIRECESIVREIASESLVSAACGEVRDWTNTSISPAEQLPNLQFLKIGLAGLVREQNWQRQWNASREILLPTPVASNSPKWIAVVYADANEAESPPATEIIATAAQENCAGVLFDTYAKNDRRFSDWISNDQLSEYLDLIHESEMFCAVAGRLTMDDVSRLVRLPVDVIAVRSAACEGGTRTASLSADRIKELQQRIAESAVVR